MIALIAGAVCLAVALVHAFLVQRSYASPSRGDVLTIGLFFGAAVPLIAWGAFA